MSRFLNYGLAARITLATLLLCLGTEVAAKSDQTLSQSSRQTSSTTGQVQNVEITKLEIGKPVSGAGNEANKHIYDLPVVQGEYARLVVKQNGSDLSVNVFGANNKRIANVDSELRYVGEETLELVGDGSGRYTIKIYNKFPMLAGSYEICLQEVRPATEKERVMHQAKALHTEAFDLYFPRIDVEKALLLAERSLDLFESVEGPDGLNVAENLATLAWIHILKAQSDVAEPLLKRALEIREKVLDPKHLLVAKSLSDLGDLWERRGYYAKAEALFLKALKIREYALGPKNSEVGYTINILANLQVQIGNYAAAKPLYQRALEIREELVGADSLRIAKLKTELAAVYHSEGNFAMAELLYQQALAICEARQGPEGDWVSSTRTDLADLYMDSGDYDGAKLLYEKVLEVRKRVLPPHHQATGYSLFKLAGYNFKTGAYEQAESFYQAAIAIWEKQPGYGSNYPSIARALDELGEIYKQRRDYAKAETVLLRAVNIVTTSRGPDNPEVGLILNHLANLYNDQGQYERAESLSQNALTILQHANGQNHPSVARTLDNLARIMLARGEVSRALEYQAQASVIEDHNLSLNLAAGAEGWKLTYLAALSKQTDRIISLQTKYGVKDPTATRLAASAVIQRKGRVLDSMSEGLDALRRRFGPEDRELLDKLNTTTAQLAWLVLNGPGRMNGAEYERRIKEAEEQRQKVEEEISHRSAGYYESSQPITLNEIQEAIPLTAALIEFAVFHPFNPKATANGSAYDEPHYVAYVLRHQGEVQAQELGRASEVDKAIEVWRQALRDPMRKDVQRLARLVDAKVMQPLRALTGDASQLLISPDGQLNLMPFAALRDEHGRYLVERFAVTYLTSGRDLLRTSVATSSKSEPVVLANPLFGAIQAPRAAQAHATNWKEQEADLKKQNGEPVDGRPDRHFLSLAGTAVEAQSIKELFPKATVLTGAAATESAVKQLTAPRILHLATHGFFLRDNATVTTSVTNPAGDPHKATTGIENPLLRSGLALAGANERQGKDNDGILTALEATGINLWGTKLVVLSACDTGVGEVRTGEGVYGLRRAFALAGAESLVMSLWPASDYTTRRFMTTYYSNLKAGMGRGAALRQVQLDMLIRNKQLHPFYWANFIQSGEWANLDGKR